MAATQIRGNSQLKDNTIGLPKVLSDFLDGTDWNITNSANDATITGIKTPVLAKDVVPKDYVDGLVDSTLKSPDDWNSAGSAFPTLYKGNAVTEGDTFYITVADTIGTGTVVNVGDLLVAKTDTPGQTDANWFVMESNRDQATESILGVAKLATQVIADAGTNDTDMITPLKLATYLANAGIEELTFTNGLTNTSGAVTLGSSSNITSDVNLSLDDYSKFYVGTTSSNYNGSKGIELELGSQYLSLWKEDPGAGQNYESLKIGNINTGEFRINDNKGDSLNTFQFIDHRSNGTRTGIEYDADYSADYTDRSLIDKGYSDSHLAGQDVNALVSAPTATEDGYAIKWNNTSGEYELSANASPLTFSNGLTESGGAVTLGGALTGDTDITAGFALNLGTDASKITNFNVNASLAATIVSDVSVTLEAPVNAALLDIAPTGAISLAIATTGYVDDEIAAITSSLTHYSNELPTVTDGNAAVAALSNLGTHATIKVTNVEVYLNGIAQVPGSGNDYTLNALTGVITFEFNLVTGDVVLVHYDKQDA